jgi:hypothetical protein
MPVFSNGLHGPQLGIEVQRFYFFNDATTPTNPVFLSRTLLHTGT